ncbi:MAG: DUF4124 domain-containing protein [Halioglobus sp.]|nr:DUF4124 domain-containing protein [Halioglobus sp.]
MKRVLSMFLLLPQLAGAGVYMCVDPASGKTTFTDVACRNNAAAEEEVKVQSTNLASGRRSARPAAAGTWRSDRDTRKSGMDYNRERGGLYDNEATAGVTLQGE